jgi:hypothetical protein
MGDQSQSSVDPLVSLLLAEAQGDPMAALEIAASIIRNVETAVSAGFVRGNFITRETPSKR